MKKLLSLLVTFNLFNSVVNATHLVGADITYACTATPDVYKITLVLYRDCSGIPMCITGCGSACTYNINATSADSGCSTFSQNIVCTLVNVRDVNPEPFCPTSRNICTNNGCKTPGTFAPGFERYEFVGFINLGPTSGIPASCCNINLNYNLCCMSNVSNTLSGFPDFYTNAIINRCLPATSCNNSPTFTNDPITILCSDQNAVINYGVVDSDGDSLSFAFAPTLGTSGSLITYKSPYTFDKPMPWTGSANGAFPNGIRCDPKTGDILFTPSLGIANSFNGIVVVEVKKWRRISGVPTLIGMVRRATLMLVLNSCPPNNTPSFITNPPSATSASEPKLSWQACPGQQLCFNVTAKDTDIFLPIISDTTRLSWDSLLITLGATFQPIYTHSQTQRNTLGPREDEWRFCWTPTASQARKEPYLFTITAKDSRCPIPGRITRGFTIQVGSQGLPLSINKLSQGCNKWSFNYTAALPSGTTTKWEIARNPGDFSFTTNLDTFINQVNTPSLFFRQGGLYAIRVTVSIPNNCDNVYYDTLKVPTNALSIATATKDTILCAGNTITLTTRIIDGTSPFTYRWFNSLVDTNSTPLNSNTSINSFTLTPTSTRSYFVQVRDSSGCPSYDSSKVLVSGELTRFITTNISCYGQATGSITAVNNTSFNYLFQLDSGNFVTSSVFQNLPSSNYSITVKDTVNNCRFTYNNIFLSTPPILKDTLVIVTKETCRGLGNATIIARANGGTPPYRYSLDSIAFSPLDTFSNLNSGIYKVHILDSLNCYTSFTRNIDPTDSLYIKQIVVNNPTCFNGSNGRISLSAIGGTRPFRYQIGLNPYVRDSIFSNLMYGNYTINVIDTNGCRISVSDSLKQPPQIILTSQITNNVCFDSSNGSVILSAVGGSPPFEYKNALNGLYDTIQTFNNLPSDTFQFFVRDSLGCEISTSAIISSPPQLRSNTLGTVVKNQSCYYKNDGSFTTLGIGGTPPYKYSIDGVNFGSTFSFNNLTPQSYTIHIRDSMNCYTNITRNINAADTFFIQQISKTNPSCFNASDGIINVRASGGLRPFKYQIGLNPLSKDSVFSNLSSGNYTITIIDTNGCQISISDSLIQSTEIIVDAQVTNNSCFNDSNGSVLITALGGIQPYKYKVGINGIYDTTSLFTALPVDTFQFFVLDNAGCEAIIIQTVSSPPLLNYDPSLTKITHQSCYGKNDGSFRVQGLGGIPPYLYSIDGTNFGSISHFNNLLPQTYTIYIRDSVNCEARVTRSLNAADTFFIGQITTTDPTCFNASNGIISINAAGGTRPYRYQIGLNPFGTDSIFNNLPGGGYTIRAADSNNCIISVSTTLVNPAPISISNIVGANSTNTNKVDTYSFVPTGSGLSYAWTVSKEGVILGPTNTTTALVRWDSAGTGTVSASIFQNASCADSASLLVAVSPTVGMNEIEQELGVNVFPNPTNTTLNIVLNQHLEFKVLKLYDIQGKLILEQPLKLTQTIDLTALPKGVYVLQIGQWHKQVLKN
jgi:hypothetical protein